MQLSVFMAGLMVGLSLIVAIGAQNAFVLRQGLKGQHVFWVCLTCAMSDAILIAMGVMSFGTVINRFPWVDPVMRYAGAAFLLWYGTKSMLSAFRSDSALVIATEGRQPSLMTAVLTCLALTWLNPHVYLDTVVLLGAVSTQFDGGKLAFGAGAVTGSFLFFFSLGYGAAHLRPLFARPSAWRILEGSIALVMWGIALGLVGLFPELG